MSLSVGSSSSALSYLQSLLQPGATSGAKGANPLEELFSSLGGSDDSPVGTKASRGSSGSAPPFQSGMLATLIALQGQGAGNAGGPSNLFSRLDTDGDGSVSKTEFATVLEDAGVDSERAEALFAKLDTDSDGSVSESELKAARKHYGSPPPTDSVEDGGSTTRTATGAAGSTLLDRLTKLQSQLLSEVTSVVSTFV